MHIRPLPYRRRPVTKQQAMSLAGPSLAVFGVMFIFSLLGL